MLLGGSGTTLQKCRFLRVQIAGGGGGKEIANLQGLHTVFTAAEGRDEGDGGGGAAERKRGA